MTERATIEARRRSKRAMFAAGVVFLLVTGGALHAQQTQRGKAIGKRVMCMCGGCNDAAGLCTHTGGTFSGPCETARSMQKEIDAHVSKGDSDDATLDAFVEEYGPTVLEEPPKHGFNMLAWIMPIVLPLLALVVVWEVVRRWRHKAALAPAGGPAIDDEFLSRARREAGNDHVE
jgi:cytochrome c-type biogenesis protein CcmH